METQLLAQFDEENPTEPQARLSPLPATARSEGPVRVAALFFSIFATRLSGAVCTNREKHNTGGKSEGHKSTHTLIKLSPLSTGDKSFAVWVPGYAGQTVFVGLRHFGPQLPRLAAEKIGRSFREETEGGWGTRRSVK